MKLRYIAEVVVALIVSYLLFAFMLWDYNPAEWDTQGRFLAVMSSATIMFVFAGFETL